SSDGWAGGARVERLNDRTVVEHGNGTRWTLSLTADVGFNTGLLDVAPLGSADVWAVGFYNQTSVLAEHWDGTGWFINSPIPIGVVSELNGVAGAASADVWAAGFSEPNSDRPNMPLAYHSHGAAWAVVTPPTVGARHTSPHAI